MRSIMFALVVFSTVARAGVAVQIQYGDIVAPQFDNNGTIIVIHPNSGNRETLSLYPSIGQGPQMVRPTSIAMLPDHNFLVVDTFTHQALTRIDASTGDRTDISSASIGTGSWGEPNTVLLTTTGDTILVCDGFVARVDLTTGNRTVLSGLGVGTGPSFSFQGAGGAALGVDGRLFIGAGGQRAVYVVDLNTGARSILSGAVNGTGPLLADIMDLVALPNGQIIVSDRNLDNSPNFTNSLVSVDSLTGNRTVISTGAYPNNEYERIALALDGKLLGSVPSLNAIFSIDPSTGARTLISGNGLGSGPGLFWGDMVQVPEPNSMILVTSCIAFLGLVRRRHDIKFRR
jgi:hypothetical protein